MSFEREIAERLVRNRMKNRIRESQESVPDSYYQKVAKILNHRLGRYESHVNVGDIDIISRTPDTITLEVMYSVDVQIPMYDPEDRRTYYETDNEYRTQTITFDFDELDESDRIVPGRDARGNRVNWIDNGDVLVSDEERRNADPNPGRDPDYEEPVKLKYISDTWNMIDKYGIKDWEDHDSYISVSKDSYEKMLNGSKNKRYIMNLRLKEDLTPSHPANGPRIGSKVRILHGGYRGQIGKVVDIDFDEEEGDQYSVETPDKSIRYLDDTDIELIKEDLTIDDDPEETDQQYSSAATSINSSKLPALFKMVDFQKGSINLDYGGGKFDNVAEYLQDKYGATNLVYDKYNRSAEHNREVLDQVRQNGGADTVTCSNVLNVIAEESERLAVLRNCKRYLKSGGTCYITVYEGNGSGEGAPSKAGYQLNRKTKDYEDEIKKVFSSVTRKGKLFICK